MRLVHFAAACALALSACATGESIDDADPDEVRGEVASPTTAAWERRMAAEPVDTAEVRAAVARGASLPMPERVTVAKAEAGVLVEPADRAALAEAGVLVALGARAVQVEAEEPVVQVAPGEAEAPADRAVREAAVA